MNSNLNYSRRRFLSRAGAGAGLIGLQTLLADEGFLVNTAGAADVKQKVKTHHDAKASNVIWVFLNGGPSHIDTFDYKPKLEKHAGEPLPGFDPKSTFFSDQQGALMPSPFKFKRYGQCEKLISEVFSKTGEHADDMAFIHSCHAESNNHGPALFQMNSGLPRLGFPSMGSWLLYGLGSESQNLPGFVVMTDTNGRGLPKGQAQNWSSGFLPGTFQGTALNVQGDPINNLSRISAITDPQQRSQLDLINRLSRGGVADAQLEDELESRLKSFELAYRMQTAAPETLDINKESAETKKLYGIGDPKCDHFAKQCLTARRMVERGVRMVQIYSGGTANARSWDGHVDIEGNHRGFGLEVDTPISGLLTDLKSKGMLDSTLVICCGEFGRQPVAQKGAKPGRDHNPFAFTTWMAGGGIKGGVSHGATDDFGYKATEDTVNVHDLHATILHLLGIDHEKLTYRFNGRDYRLTDIYGDVIKSVINA